MLFEVKVMFSLFILRASDVYAFGTVWYELLTGEWPWKQQPPESIIWQVGCGMKPTLANLAASKEVKDVLMQCWVHSPDTRPGFPDIALTLELVNTAQRIHNMHSLLRGHSPRPPRRKGRRNQISESLLMR